LANIDTLKDNTETIKDNKPDDKNIIKDEVIPVITGNKLHELQTQPVELNELEEIKSKIQKIKRQYDEIRTQNQSGGKPFVYCAENPSFRCDAIELAVVRPPDVARHGHR
jgi:hypothetical protein